MPTETILGPSVPPPMKIIEKEYLACGEGVYGCRSGLMLENQMGLTTQNPSVLEIVTNKATKRVRHLGPAAGYNVDTLLLDLIRLVPSQLASPMILFV